LADPHSSQSGDLGASGLLVADKKAQTIRYDLGLNLSDFILPNSPPPKGYVAGHVHCTPEFWLWAGVLER